MPELTDLTLPTHIELPEEEVDLSELPNIEILSPEELTAAYMALVETLSGMFGLEFAQAVLANANEMLILIESQREEREAAEDDEG